MKSTLKAFKYSFKLVNLLVTASLLILFLLMSFYPLVNELKYITKYASDPEMFEYIRNDILEVSLISLVVVLSFMGYINQMIGNSKFSYSVSCARKLHTVVPVIYAYIPLVFIFTVVVLLTAMKLGVKAISAAFIPGALCYSVFGLVSILYMKRQRDAIILFILFMVCFMTFTSHDDGLVKLNIPVPIVIVLSYTVLAAGFVLTCRYMNRLWDKKIRYKKLKNGYLYRTGR